MPATAATVAVGAYSAHQAGNAADAQSDSSQAAIDEQRRQYDQSRADQQPYMGFGQGSGGLAGLQALANGDYSGFMNSPDYLASQKAGLYALDHSAAARGRLNSGGFAADLQNAGQDHAAGFLNNYRGALQWGANLGQNAAAGVGQLGQQSANQIGAQRNMQGNAQASAYGANAQFASGLGSAFGDWYGNNSANNGGGSGFYFGNNPGRG